MQIQRISVRTSLELPRIAIVSPVTESVEREKKTGGRHSVRPPASSRCETAALLGLLILAGFVRLYGLDTSPIEHFDEGVYSSNRWAADPNTGRFPLQHFYAPPLLPALIDLCIDLFGTKIGPLIPAVFLGCLSVWIAWKLLRTAFGTDAAISGCLLLSLNDFHILYSRRALTDVPMSAGVLLAVWLGTRACVEGGFLRMCLAGLAVSFAWWTKYNGWLPLPILLSGLIAFLVIHKGRYGDRRLTWAQLVFRWLTISVVAVAAWAPVYFQLPNGYGEIAENHAGYSHGFDKWIEALKTQFASHSILDGWLSTAGMLLAIVCGGLLAGFVDPRFTWNIGAKNDATNAGETSSAKRIAFFSQIRILLFGALASGLTIYIGSSALLLVLGLAGIIGFLIWPVSGHKPRETLGSRVTAGSDYSTPYCWVLLAWLVSLSLVTPLYYPYPRITTPWVVAACLCAGVGIAWWSRALRNVIFNSLTSGKSSSLDRVKTSHAGVVTTALVLFFAVIYFLWHVKRDFENNRIARSIPAWQSRPRLENIAKLIVKNVVPHWHKNAGGSGDGEVFAMVYGEPSLLFHLNANGVPAVPIASLGSVMALPAKTRSEVILIAGPHAADSDEFEKEWAAVGRQFKLVANYDFRPADFVLLNDDRTREALVAGDDVDLAIQLFRFVE